MNRLAAQAMEEGALGLTAAWHAKGPEHPQEVVEMAKVVKRYGGYYGVHVGREGFDMMEELAKTLRSSLSRRRGASVAGPPNEATQLESAGQMGRTT